MVQKEYAGTESKSETEKLLHKALEDYEDKKFQFTGLPGLPSASWWSGHVRSDGTPLPWDE